MGICISRAENTHDFPQENHPPQTKLSKKKKQSWSVDINIDIDIIEKHAQWYESWIKPKNHHNCTGIECCFYYKDIKFGVGIAKDSTFDIYTIFICQENFDKPSIEMNEVMNIVNNKIYPPLQSRPARSEPYGFGMITTFNEYNFKRIISNINKFNPFIRES